MTDRLLVFSNPKIQKLLKEKFIPVACNDWYQRRRQDAEGKFFRAVADQSPRKGHGGTTRQGHYIFTATGKLLGYNNNRGPERRLRMIRSALKKWNQLPDGEKTTKVPAHGPVDQKYHRTLPSGAQVIKSHTRALEYQGNTPRHLSENIPGRLAAVDHLWLTNTEIKQLHTLLHSGGGTLPKPITHRIARFHLTDSTRGEPPFWKTQEIKNLTITLNQNGKLSGNFHLETPDQSRGYQGNLSGLIAFSNKAKLTTFELLATGHHWGEGRYTPGARPGKTPLAIHFSHIPTPTTTDLIPPQAIHWEKGYWQPHK